MMVKDRTILDWVKKLKLRSFSGYVVLFFILLFLLPPLLCNDMPLLVVYKNKLLFPVFSYPEKIVLNKKCEEINYSNFDWKRKEINLLLRSAVVYSPGKTDLQNTNYLSPFDEQFYEDENHHIIKMPWRYRHWLGTGKRGEDVLAGIIYGTRTSVLIGLLATLIAGILGVGLGAMAGYFGDNKISIAKSKILILMLSLIAAFYYGAVLRKYELQDALLAGPHIFIFQLIISASVMVTIITIFLYTEKKLRPLNYKNNAAIPVDIIVSKSIEIFTAIPKLIIIITIAALVQPSVALIAFIIGVTSWAGIARLTRSEFLKQKNMHYAEASRALGISEFKIIVKHILPNCLPVISPACCILAANAILAESALSFLGAGVSLQTTTLGRLIASAKENFNAWWLIVFPGMILFGITMLLTILANRFQKTSSVKDTHLHI